MSEAILFRQKRKIDKLQKKGAEVLQRAAEQCCCLEDELAAVHDLLKDIRIPPNERIMRSIVMIETALEDAIIG